MYSMGEDDVCQLFTLQRLDPGRPRQLPSKPCRDARCENADLFNTIDVLGNSPKIRQIARFSHARSRPPETLGNSDTPLNRAWREHRRAHAPGPRPLCWAHPPSPQPAPPHLRPLQTPVSAKCRVTKAAMYAPTEHGKWCPFH